MYPIKDNKLPIHLNPTSKHSPCQSSVLAERIALCCNRRPIPEGINRTNISSHQDAKITTYNLLVFSTEMFKNTSWRTMWFAAQRVGLAITICGSRKRRRWTLTSNDKSIGLLQYGCQFIKKYLIVKPFRTFLMQEIQTLNN